MESASTYRAVQAAARGKLEMTRKPLRDPGPEQVRIRVEACGVCHSELRHRGRSLSDRMAPRARS